MGAKSAKNKINENTTVVNENISDINQTSTVIADIKHHNTHHSSNVFTISNSLLIESMPLLRELCGLKQSLINLQAHDGMLWLFSEDSDRYMKIALPIHGYLQTDILGFDAHILVDIIKKTDRKEEWTVEFKSKENLSIWQTSTAQIKLVSSTVNEISRAHEELLHDISLDVARIREGAKSVGFAISQSDTNPILNGILFKFFKDRLEMVACDNFRLAVYKIHQAFDIEHEFVLPAKTMSVLTFIMQQPGATLNIKCYGNKVHFYGTYIANGVHAYSASSASSATSSNHTSTGSDVIISWSMDSAVIMGNFPRYEAIIANIAKSYVVCGAYALYKMIDQVSVIAKDTSIVNMRLNTSNSNITDSASQDALVNSDQAISNSSITIKSNNVMLGEYVNSMQVDSHLDSDYNVDFRTHLIVGLLKTFEKKTVRMHIGHNSKLIIFTIDGEKNFYAGIVPLQKH